MLRGIDNGFAPTSTGSSTGETDHDTSRLLTGMPGAVDRHWEAP